MSSQLLTLHRLRYFDSVRTSLGVKTEASHNLLRHEVCLRFA